MIIGGFQHIDVTGVTATDSKKIEGIYNTIKNSNGKPIVIHNYDNFGNKYAGIVSECEFPIDEGGEITLHTIYAGDFVVNSNDIVRLL